MVKIEIHITEAGFEINKMTNIIDKILDVFSDIFQPIIGLFS
jgi:hypothetical protein